MSDTLRESSEWPRDKHLALSNERIACMHMLQDADVMDRSINPYVSEHVNFGSHLHGDFGDRFEQLLHTDPTLRDEATVALYNHLIVEETTSIMLAHENAERLAFDMTHNDDKISSSDVNIDQCHDQADSIMSNTKSMSQFSIHEMVNHIVRHDHVNLSTEAWASLNMLDNVRGNEGYVTYELGVDPHQASTYMRNTNTVAMSPQLLMSYVNRDAMLTEMIESPTEAQPVNKFAEILAGESQTQPTSRLPVGLPDISEQLAIPGNAGSRMQASSRDDDRSSYSQIPRYPSSRSQPDVEATKGDDDSFSL